MDQPHSNSDQRGPAPADAIGRQPWPLWQRIVAYAAMSALALASIWFIDQRVNIPGRDSSPASLPAQK